MTERKYTAENGAEITDELIDQWADEAEHGFPGAQMTPFAAVAHGKWMPNRSTAHHPSERHDVASHRG